MQEASYYLIRNISVAENEKTKVLWHLHETGLKNMNGTT